MKHVKRGPSAWDRIIDRIYYSEVVREIWNKIICPAIEISAIVFFALLAVIFFYVMTVALILLCG